MPSVKKGESESDYVSRCIPIVMHEGTTKDNSQAAAICHSKYREHGKKSHKERLCFKQDLRIKEEGESIIVSGLVATTHPDRVGDILSKKAIQEIVDRINDVSTAGGTSGAYRSVSLFHDWIKQEDPTLDEAAFLKPTARTVQLEDGHWGAEVDAEINKFYRGSMSPDEIKYRIENKQIAGFSIEYDTDDTHSRKIMHGGEEFRFIDGLTEFGGVGLARARMIANPHAVIYKEIEESLVKKEESVMVNETKETVSEPKIEEEKVEVPVEKEEQKESSEVKETKKEVSALDIKELVKTVKEEAMKELEVKSKIIKTTEGAKNMEAKEIPLSVKEMNSSLNAGKIDLLKFKEYASQYLAENPKIDAQLSGIGVPLHTTMKVKCEGNKLKIVGGLQIKSVLDTTTNAGAYTEAIVEFADLFVPGLVDTFNNQTNLFGALPKRDHLMGGDTYGWRIKTDQSSSLSVDPDDPTVVFDPVGKLKLHTAIKEYRVGVSVTDFVAHHARATMGDVLMLEAEARMRDLLRDINNDLFTEQVDTAGNKILGLEAVADSAGNTAMYGKTRSTANRLAPASATDTYTEVGGALTTAYMRLAARKVEVEGAARGNLRYVMNPAQRDALFELEDGNLNYYSVQGSLGFDGLPRFDGIPIIVDSSCQTDAVFVVDFESYYLVISRPPQMIGLAKVGAADSAYISVYLAAVYEQPRRVYMLNTLT